MVFVLSKRLWSVVKPMASDASRFRSRDTVHYELCIIAALLNRFIAVNDDTALDQNYADHQLNKLPQSIWIHILKIFSMSEKKCPNEADFFLFVNFPFN